MRTLRLAAIVLAALAVPLWPAPAVAVGPVDGEVTALYWDSDTDVSGVSEGSGDLGGRAEVWFLKRYGFSGEFFQPSPGGALDGTDLEYLNLDAKFRILAPSENNFLAVGVGWQKIDVSGDLTGDTSGPRVVAEGRFSFKIVYIYGRVAWLPELGDLTLGSDTFTNGQGQELEAGVQIKPFPFFQIFAGYRADKVTFDAPEGGSLEVKNEGPVAGIGFNF
jgi:hypothetical protein